MKLEIIKNSSSGFWLTLNDRRIGLVQLTRGGPEKYLYRWLLDCHDRDISDHLYNLQNLGAVKENVEKWVNQQEHVIDYCGEAILVTSEAKFDQYSLFETQIPSNIKVIKQRIER